MGSTDPSNSILPDGTNTDVDIPVNLPADFKKGSKAKLIVKYLTFSSPCTISLRISAVVRARSGKVISLGPPGAMGVSNGAPQSLTLPQSVLKTTTHTVVGMTSGSVQGQRKGDMITFIVTRIGDDALDNCNAFVAIKAAELRYQTP